MEEQLADKEGRSQKQLQQMEFLMGLPFAECTSDVLTFEMIPDTTKSERGRLFTQMTSGRGRLMRGLVVNEQPRAPRPEPAKPQFAEVRTELRNIGPRPMPSQESVNFLTK